MTGSTHIYIQYSAFKRKNQEVFMLYAKKGKNKYFASMYWYVKVKNLNKNTVPVFTGTVPLFQSSCEATGLRNFEKPAPSPQTPSERFNPLARQWGCATL